LAGGVAGEEMVCGMLTLTRVQQAQRCTRSGLQQPGGDPPNPVGSTELCGIHQTLWKHVQ